MQPQHHIEASPKPEPVKQSGMPDTKDKAFDTWMWQYILTEIEEKHAAAPENSTHSHQDKGSDTVKAFDDDGIEDRLDLVWKLVRDRKYHQAREQCQDVLEEIEHSLAYDFGQDVTTFTLYDDDNEERRESYLDTLKVFQHILRCLVFELLLESDDVKDVESGYARYQELRHDIQQAVSKTAYLLGDDYDSEIFFTF
jgi:hypothetical protein